MGSSDRDIMVVVITIGGYHH